MCGQLTSPAHQQLTPDPYVLDTAVGPTVLTYVPGGVGSGGGQAVVH